MVVQGKVLSRFSKLITSATDAWTRSDHFLNSATAWLFHFQETLRMNSTFHVSFQPLNFVRTPRPLVANLYPGHVGHGRFLTVVDPWMPMTPVQWHAFPERSYSQMTPCQQQTPFQHAKYFHSGGQSSKSSSNWKVMKYGRKWNADGRPKMKDFSFEEDKDKENKFKTPHGTKRHPEGVMKSPDQKKLRFEAEKKQGKDPLGLRSFSASQSPINLRQADDVIVKFYNARAQAKDMYVKKMKLRDALYSVFKEMFPYCGLYVIGSSMTGFGSSSSDMDLCLMLSHNEIDQKREATDILKILYKSLSRCDFLKNLKLIHAKVPILKFKDKISSVECDLNINNSVGIRNTHLLSAYSMMDSRIPALVLFVKHWAKVQNINDASQGTISSYSLVLMVIHYLQYGCNPSVIPSLQQKYPHKFDSSVDVRVLSLNEKLAPYESPNHESLGELFVGFLRYYTSVFNFGADVISIRLGRTVSQNVVRQLAAQAGGNANQWKCLCIEEPFSLNNTAYSVFDESIFRHIQEVIRCSYLVISRTGDLESITTHPLHLS